MKQKKYYNLDNKTYKQNKQIESHVIIAKMGIPSDVGTFLLLSMAFRLINVCLCD